MSPSEENREVIGQTIRMQETPLFRAPDGSEIHELPRVAGGSMAHCRLPPGAVTLPVRHRTIEEIWYVIEGSGAVWRGSMPDGQIVRVEPGTGLTIPLGTSFQFRASTDQALVMILATIPPWPGDDEAIASEGPWTPTVEGP
jgi:mannose-6-phosphate isomerase-like protein (cupin superfamily)